jgi:hypothetical protein
MKTLVASIALLSLAGCGESVLSTEAINSSETELIYGADDRQEAYEVLDPAMQTVMQATTAVMNVGDLTPINGGYSLDLSTTFGAAHRLCASEPYANQPAPAYCSGFLVADDLMVTAGHCIDNTSCAGTAFVFGFEMIDAGTVVGAVPTSSVYTCSQIVARAETNTNDYALVRLDRPVTGHTPLPVRTSGTIANGSAIIVAGHPSGLPLKVAGGANVQENASSSYFSANLDTYGGNSGSPVVSPAGVVEGILVRGNTDFNYVRKQRCYVSNVCSDNGCPGFEDVTRITQIADLIPSEPACAIDADCADNNPCNGAEACDAGRCVAGTAPDCAGADACETGRCVAIDASTWACDFTPVTCNDGDACTTDRCDPAAGCQAEPMICGAGEYCADGLCEVEPEPPVCSSKGVACASGADCCSGTCHHRKGTCR